MNPRKHDVPTRLDAAAAERRADIEIVPIEDDVMVLLDQMLCRYRAQELPTIEL